ncbi:ABC transporter substrate-binding protein [Spongiivirga citrea]|uniref:ABC transporter substrate-binding protein n=1 Tax=Spongiivirga citrea TaxID=1481457 RepID=A0A6M0CKH3_9FLAO|nr:ABC transporter substrate-binding protein [Spongiivirga citrea]NER18465.1 ABC transporter substrate-binding protein [Spongiivirga citrea]
MRYFSYLTLLLLFFIGCKKPIDKKLPSLNTPEVNEVNNPVTIKYASGLELEKNSNFTVVTIKDPWPNAEKSFKYAIINRAKAAATTFAIVEYDAIILTPVEKLVVTSTTHIPSLEALNSLDALVGFPDTKYISSKAARTKIDNGTIKDIGNNESLNTEMLLSIEPELVVGFSINNDNKTYNTIKKAKIPVLYNGDWTEKTPLGKAEWIKLFGLLFEKEQQADRIFKQIETDYLEAKNLASTITSKPTVLSGAMYKDIWYLPAGESFQTQFLKDANVNYLWSDTKGTGSLSLNIESVLEKGKKADFWIAPGQFESYEDMKNGSEHYSQFDAFKNKKVFNFTLTKGETGGILYYELGQNRPDLVLKDMINIFHPGLLENYQATFFKPLR